MEPGRDATTTSFDGTKSIPKPKRKLYVASLVAAFAITVALSFVSGGFDRAAGRMEFKGSRIPVEVVLWMGRLLREPLWLGVAVFAVVFLALLALKGLLDRILKLLIGVNNVWLLLFLLLSLTSWVAFFKVAEKLKPGGG